jgi:hypothetical protein
MLPLKALGNGLASVFETGVAVWATVECDVALIARQVE